MNKPEHWQEKNRKEAMFAFTYQPLVYVMDAYISFWYREERNPVWFLFIVDQTGCGLLWSPVLGCLLWLWQFSSEIRRKHTGRNLFYPVYSLAACLLGEIVVSVIDHCVVLRAAGREEKLFVWACAHAHVYPAPWWSRIWGMQRNAISRLELITNRWVLHFARLNTTHAVHFHIKENTAACTLYYTRSYFPSSSQ